MSAGRAGTASTICANMGIVQQITDWISQMNIELTPKQVAFVYCWIRKLFDEEIANGTKDLEDIHISDYEGYITLTELKELVKVLEEQI
jgi:phage major head subunit gpT-like protein